MAIWAFPLVGVVSAEPPPATGSVPAWAYGGINTYNVSWQGARGVYVGSATYGFSDVLTQFNTSSTAFTLTENHTVGAAIDLTYCRPNCASPTLTEQYTYRAWETWLDAANFTTSANVSLRNASAVPALGIASSNASVAANITEHLTATRNGSTHLVHELFASSSAHLALVFTPALGLFPINLTANVSWVGSASFDASGTWRTDFLLVGPLRQEGPDTGSGTLTGSGVATLAGTERGSVILSERRLTQVAMKLAVHPHLGSPAFLAGFDLMDGFTIVPHATDLMQSSSSDAWRSLAAGNTTAQSSVMDLTPPAGNAPGRFVASAWTYVTSVSSPDPSTPGASQTVQGAPISPSEATSTAGCLQGTESCASTGTNPNPGATGGTALLPIVFLSVGTVALVVIVGGILISQRRRIPPPSYPNAALYPPGPAARGTRRTAPTDSEPTPDDDDPLQNLW
ncbi:MAG: hypothetical protein ACLQD8_00800 [Thermoplasmata archaeon]